MSAVDRAPVRPDTTSTRTTGRTDGPVAHRGTRRRALRPGRLAAVSLGLVVSGLAVAPTTAAAAGGTLSLPAGQSDGATAQPRFADGTAAATFTVPARSGGSVYVGVTVRGSGGASGYRTKVGVRPNGTWHRSLVRLQGGRETVLWRQEAPGVLATGRKVVLETAASGSGTVTVRSRAWVAGTAKPGWQHTRSDASSARVTSAGPARVWAYSSSRNTRRISVAFSDFAGATTASTTTTTPTNPSTPTSTSTSGKPSKDNTGVPAGTRLTVHNGDLTIKKAGTVIDRMDVRGFITVKAPNVTIRRSIVRGGKATFNRGVITNYGNDKLVIEDVDILPSNATVYQDGIKGSDFTMTRVYVTGNVDSVKVHGAGPVLIRNSLLENTRYFSKDPNQGGKATHNDGVQVLNGANISIHNNTIRGQQNFAVLGAADIGNTSGLSIRNNWLDGGHCTVKVQERKGHNLDVLVSGNKFGPHRKIGNCKINAVRGSKVSASNNKMESDGSAVGVLWTDS